MNTDRIYSEIGCYMLDKNIIDTHKRRLEFYLERMPTLMDKIRFRRKPIDLGACYASLSDIHLNIGACSYFIDGDMKALKQNFYTASQLTCAKLRFEDKEAYVNVRQTINWALLSDNPDIINTIANLETPTLINARHKPLDYGFQAYMWQAAIKSDYETLAEKIEKLAKNGRKADRLLCSEKKDFFSLLIQEDKQGLEDLILRGAKQKEGSPLMDDFVAELSTYQAKLCWFRGIPVEIDSPLVPMDLMPIKPLEHYDDVYDFLQPNWIPLQEGMLGKISGWFKK
jgi:hypothetical protein